MSDANIRAVITAQDRASGVLAKFDNNISNLGATALNITQRLTQLGGAAIATGAAIGIKMDADIETARAGFITLLGSADKADAILTRIKKDAASTPFEFKGLVQANQLLTSVTKDGNKAQDLLLNVGKALAAMGKGQPELDRIIINLQQIGSVGRASLIDIRQFAFNGIPIFEMLTQTTGKTGKALEDFISDGGVTFGLLTELFRKAGAEGGRFADAFKNQAGTFSQLASNMKDTANVELGFIFEPLFNSLKKVMSGISELSTTPAWANMRVKAQESVQSVINTFGDLVRVVDRVINAFKEGGVSGAFNQMVTEIKKAIDRLDLKSNFTKALGALVNAIKDFPWEEKSKDITAGLIGMFAAIDSEAIAKAAVVGFVVAAPQIVTGIIEGIIEAVIAHPLDLLQLFLLLGFTPEIMVAKFAQVLSKVPLAGPLLEWILTSMKGVGDFITQPIKDLFKNLGLGALDGLKTGFGGIADVFLTNILVGLRIIETRIGSFVEGGKGIGAGIVRGLASFADGFLSAISWPLRAGLDLLYRMVDPFFKVGVAIVQGIVNGIKSVGGSISGVIGDLAQGAINTAKSTLRIKSPSKVFEDIGTNVGLGLAQGISGTSGIVEGALGTITPTSMAVPTVGPSAIVNTQTTQPTTVNITFSGIFTGNEAEFRKLAVKVFQAAGDAAGAKNMTIAEMV